MNKFRYLIQQLCGGLTNNLTVGDDILLNEIDRMMGWEQPYGFRITRNNPFSRVSIEVSTEIDCVEMVLALEAKKTVPIAENALCEFSFLYATNDLIPNLMYLDGRVKGKDVE